MADQKITELTELTAIDTDDLFVVVDDPSGTPVTKKITWSNIVKDILIEWVIDGGGSEITTGVKGDIGPIPFSCTIAEWTLLADTTGSIVVNIWKDTYANFPPTVSDKITASAPPTISGADKAQSSSLGTWTTTISEGDILRFNVDSVSSIQRVTLVLRAERN